jgi:hypothetical protein
MAFEPLFTPDEAQALLESTVRPLAEQIVALRAASRQREVRWQKVVLAVGSNGGALSPREVEELREQLEADADELRGLVRRLVRLGVQIKDLDRGLIDFPSQVDGRAALLCWQVGEERIEYWHGPEDGFAGRRPL